MARERIIDASSQDPEERRYDLALRPETLDECIGQEKVIAKLRIALTAAKQRAEPVEHILLHGPPGLGKTTLAHVIAHEMGARLRTSSGPALTRPGDLMGILTNLQQADILFVDEIHRLPTVVEEFMYPAMEDFQVDFTVDSGVHAKTINIPLQPFTLIGATTRAGMISAPLRARFGIQQHLEFWSQDHLAQCLARSARILALAVETEALNLLSRCSRGTPRVANRLLRRVRDYAQVRADGRITRALAEKALRIEEIDELGLDPLDRTYLRTLIATYQGGPAGIEALAATLGEDRDTLEDVVEPYLLQIGFVARTRNGRTALAAAYRQLGLQPPAAPPARTERQPDPPEDASLFE
ncbi:MAG: Holliday junction branch migration DNA helicase RuvB [Sedimentisphaerales bacterium]|nr:Holliday junction branch migration DNA helicase RuvB [Sedimentisphaerales bacterium]